MDWIILLAGGSGERAGNGVNKVYRPLAGAAMLSYPLRGVRAFQEPVGLVVVARKEDRSMLDRILAGFTDLKPRVVLGGKTRYQSELAGLAATGAREGDLIGIHDGARPFLTADLWESCRTSAAVTGGAIPVVDPGPVFSQSGGELRAIPGVVKAQTPQIFESSTLQAAFRHSGSKESARAGFDTAETVSRHSNLAISAVRGDHRNLKITTMVDFALADDLVGQWAPERWLAR